MQSGRDCHSSPQGKHVLEANREWRPPRSPVRGERGSDGQRDGCLRLTLSSSCEQQSLIKPILLCITWQLLSHFHRAWRKTTEGAKPLLYVFLYTGTMATYSLILTFVIAALWRVSGEPQTLPSPATQFNSTSSSSSSSSIISEDGLTSNVTDAAVGSRISSLMTHLPTLKNIVIFICVLTAVLITVLVIKVIR